MRSTPFFALLLASACSSYSPGLPAAPFLCGSSAPLCPDGFSCQTEMGTGRMVCVAANGEIPDGTSGPCLDDSHLEPNNDISMAFQTDVDNPRMSLPLSGLSICPAGDKDIYAVTLSKGVDPSYESLSATIKYDSGGAPLQLSLLNEGGMTIVNGGPVMGMDGTVSAAANMIPNGQYYVEVFGPAAGQLTTNNYTLSIDVTGP